MGSARGYVRLQVKTSDRQMRGLAAPAADGSSYFVLRGLITDDDSDDEAEARATDRWSLHP